MTKTFTLATAATKVLALAMAFVLYVPFALAALYTAAQIVA